MARRKNAFLSDGSDSEGSSGGSDGGYNSQEDDDSRAERRLFEFNGNKRRRTGGRGGKAHAWEGVFGEEEDEYGGRGIGSRKSDKPAGSRSDITKAPAFVSSGDPLSSKPSFVPPSSGVPGKVDDDPEEEAALDVEGGPDAGESSDGSETDSEVDSSPPSPRVREDDYDDETPAPRIGLGGLGFSKSTMNDDGEGRAESARAESPGESVPMPPFRSRPGIGSKAGIGARNGESSKRGNAGIGASRTSDLPAAEDVPTTFGRRPTAVAEDEEESDRARSSFKGRTIPTTAPQATNLTASEAAHFRNIAGNIGFKLLQRSGWNAGEGLGKDRSGRAVPVAVGKVMRGQGISSGIRTEDSKREARRRGEIVSDDEEEKPARRGRGGARAAGSRDQKPKQDDGWRKQKKVKIKVEHKTYEQILAEAGDANGAGIGQILDARGGELKEVQSLAALNLSGWTPTAENAQLPELRHNLRLIVDVAKADVDALAREGKSVDERRKWSLREKQMASNKMNIIDHNLSRLEQIQIHISDISTLIASQSTNTHPSLEPLTKTFNALIHDFSDEYVEFSLDDVIVGAIGQLLRTTLAEWQPFDVSSDVLLSSLKQWRHAFRLPDPREGGLEKSSSDEAGRGMTAWESFLWSTWLPKVRSAINNQWSALSPQAAVHLLESWDPLLPGFIRDNILDQLVLPKVRQAIEEWDGRRSRSGKTASLAGIVFPWLPLLGSRLEEILEGAKRRIRHVMRKWVVRDGVPEELARWRKDIFSSKEWDELMLRNVVPKLGVCLRDDFKINPRKQDMVPLEEWVLPWHRLIRGSTFAQLIEANFFPEWLNILYIWLIQPNFNSDEVATWFKWWKEQFPESVQSMPSVSYGFTTALELMQEAMRLGVDAPSRLRKPKYEPPKSSRHIVKPVKPVPARPVDAPPTDITFRSLAEDIAAQKDLIFLPLGRSHDRTGKPLFKVCKNVGGKGGITVYVGEDAVFAQEDDGVFRAVSLDDMVTRALS